MIDPSGAEVFWDYQLGTYTGILNGLKVGLFGGDITAVTVLEERLGIALSASTGAALQEQFSLEPYLANKLFVSKLQFMDLFLPSDLERIYTTAKTVVAVQIELDRVNRSSNDQIELTDPRTIAGLAKMEAMGLIQEVGGAARILRGESWQQ